MRRGTRDEMSGTRERHPPWQLPRASSLVPRPSPLQRPRPLFPALQPLRRLPPAERVAQRVGGADARLEGEVEVGGAAFEGRPAAAVEPEAEVRDLGDVEADLE